MYNQLNFKKILASQKEKTIIILERRKCLGCLKVNLIPIE
jgi:ribose 5-phosphate isomerase